MNRKPYWKFMAIVAVPLIALLASCTNPLASLAGRSGPAKATGTQGTISIRIDRLSPVITKLFSSKSVAVSQSPSRAFLAADKVHFELMSGSDLFTKWDESVAAAIGQTGSFTVSDKPVPEGTYTLKVQIFDSITDPLNPMVGGSSVSFVVAADQKTDVTVTCKPLPPNLVTLSKGSEVEKHPLSAWSGDQYGVTIGTEQWYSYTPTSDDTYLALTVEPLGPLGMNEFIAIMPYDSQGNALFQGTPGLVTAKTSFPFPATPGETVYLAVIDLAADMQGTGVGFTVNNPGYSLAINESGPPNFQVSNATSSSVTLEWDAVQDATSYTLYKGSSSDQASSSPTHSGSELTFDDGSVVAGQTYYYWVEATLSTGATTAVSGPLTVTVPEAAATALTANGNYYLESIASNQFQWYYFDATPGTTYLVNWNDHFQGSNQYGAELLVSAFHEDQTTAYFTSVAGGYYSSSSYYSAGSLVNHPIDSTQTITIPATSTDQRVYLFVKEKNPGASSGTYQLSVGPNNAPVITTAYASPNPITLGAGPINLVVSATDPESRAVSYSWQIEQQPDWTPAQIANSTQAQASFTPDISGAYTFSIAVSDPYGGVTTASIPVTVDANTSEQGGVGYGIY